MRRVRRLNARLDSEWCGIVIGVMDLALKALALWKLCELVN